MGFIEDFVTYHNIKCGAPTMFAKLEAIFKLGASMGRNFVNPLNVEERHNFFVFLVGATSKFMKSSSMKVMKEFVKSVGINELPLETSPEALISAMESMPQSVYIKDEFGSELARISKKNSYMSGFMDILAHLWGIYDVYSRKTITHGDVTINEPYLSVFIATTDDRFDTYARNDTVMSGFLPRFLIYFPDNDDKRDFKPLFYPTDIPNSQELIDLKTKIHNFLSGIRGTAAPISMKFSDINYFNAQLKTIQDNAEDENPTLAALYNKLGEYLIKIADVMKISDMDVNAIVSSTTIYVENEYIDRAMEVINRVVSKYPAVFENRIEFKNFNLAIRRILEYIRVNQTKYDTLPITRPEILNASCVDNDTFTVAMTTMIESGKILQLFAKELINPANNERVRHGKEVFVLSEHYREFSRMIDNDMLGITLQVHRLRSGTAITDFSQSNTRLNEFI